MNELKQQILDLLNNSGLGLEPILFILRDVYRDAEDTYNQLLAQASQETIETTKEESES